MVKKEKARAIEDSLIKAATNGQLKGKVNSLKSYAFYHFQ
jgi:DNA-binding TFAR19-related protein (PDSD5 family)